DRWQGVFARREAHERAVEHLLASACTMGRRTVSRSIIALGRDDQDWSADYKFYSRSPWNENDLFEPVFHHYVRLFEGPGDLIGVAWTTPSCPRPEDMSRMLHGIAIRCLR